MIFNYALTHHCCEESIFDETVYQNFIFLFEEVINHNIILIVDNENYLIDKLKKSILTHIDNDENDHIINLISELEDQNKLYKHNYKYDENDIDLYLDSIVKKNINLDAILVDYIEEKNFMKAIPIQKFNKRHKFDEERRKISKSGLKLTDFNIKQLDKHYERLTWDSPVFYYYDYNLGSGGLKDYEIKNLKSITYNNKNYIYLPGGIKNKQLEKFKAGFTSLKRNIEEIYKYFNKSKRITINIYTPQPNKIYKNLSLEERIEAYEKNRRMLDFLNNNIFDELNNENIEFILYFYDSLMNEDSKFGSSEHNRIFYSLSSKPLDVAKGLDIYDVPSGVIQQGKWRFISDDKDEIYEEILQKNPRISKKYEEKINHLILSRPST